MLSIERLSLENAQILIEGATEHANAIGVPMSIAIVDESGNLIAFHRMDGVKVSSIGLSQDKAFTSALSRRPTSYYNKNAVPGNSAHGIQNAWGGRFSTIGGGVPVEDEGTIVGAIGVSGGTSEQDIECAEAAIAYFSAD